MSNGKGESERIVLTRSIQAAKHNTFSGITAGILALIFLIVVRASWLFECAVLLFILMHIGGYFYSLRDKEPWIILDEQEIYARGVGHFAWESIQEVWPEYYRRVCVLVLKLKTGEHVRFTISHLTMRPDDIRYYIEKQIVSLQPIGGTNVTQTLAS